MDKKKMSSSDKDLFLNAINTHMTKVCSFCDVVTINESESVCNACMKKYGIGTFDNSKDGCGCDC
jgi:hypothetical protein